MSRKSAFEIVLNGEERAELERRVACYTLPHKVVQRAKMILYAAEGQSDVEIARRLETAAGVVGRWRKRFFEERLAGLEDRGRAGRPRRFPPGAGRRGEGGRLRAADQVRPAAVALHAQLHRLVVERGVTDASPSTIWRWLHEDAIKPWQQRCWIFMRDPAFREKAGRVLDLYQRRFQGRRLYPDELVVCADEKSQLQALGRRHATMPAGPQQPALVEFEYRRHGTLAYLAAWDVHHANLFDRVEAKTGIEPFGRLVAQVMRSEPYASARTVFWIVDNGSSHAGRASVRRLEGAYENLRLIHLPVHASWLNQIELYFSILQRKALTPNDFDSLNALSERLLRFGEHYRQIAKPFDWTFTRTDLDRVLAKIEPHEPQLTLAA